jgi:hypothetical protein
LLIKRVKKLFSMLEEEEEEGDFTFVRFPSLPKVSKELELITVTLLESGQTFVTGKLPRATAIVAWN